MEAKYLTVRRGSMSQAGFGGAAGLPWIANERGDSESAARMEQALLVFDEPVSAAAMGRALKVIGLGNPGHCSMMLGPLLPGGWVEICLFDTDEGGPLRAGVALARLLGAKALRPWQGSRSASELRAELEKLELGSSVSTAPEQGSWAL